jgi:hypothetical protein
MRSIACVILFLSTVVLMAQENALREEVIQSMAHHQKRQKELYLRNMKYVMTTTEKHFFKRKIYSTTTTSVTHIYGEDIYSSETLDSFAVVDKNRYYAVTKHNDSYDLTGYDSWTDEKKPNYFENSFISGGIAPLLCPLSPQRSEMALGALTRDFFTQDVVYFGSPNAEKAHVKEVHWRQSPKYGKHLTQTTELSRARFDGDNHMLYLGGEYYNTGFYDTSGSSIIKEELGYRFDRSLNLKVPSYFTQHIQYPNEEPILLIHTDIISVERIYPKPEDFLLEKRFGLTTPSGPVKLAMSYDDLPEEKRPERLRQRAKEEFAQQVQLIGLWILAGVIILGGFGVFLWLVSRRIRRRRHGAITE